MASTSSSKDIAALQTALAAEHAAVYGYGVAGALLGGADLANAKADWNAHQLARDNLQAMLTRLGATPVAASPAYKLPFTVGSSAASARMRSIRARRLLVSAWRALRLFFKPSWIASSRESWRAVGDWPRTVPATHANPK